MSNIIITMNPEVSAFNATLKLANELKKRGHNTIYTGPSDFKEYIQVNGHNYFSASKDFIAYNPTSYEFYESVLELDAIIESFQPDLALIDTLHLMACISYLRYKVPMLGLNTTLSYRLRTTSPPIFSDKIPEDPRLFKTRIKNIIKWLLITKKDSNDWFYHPIIKFLRYFIYLKNPYKLDKVRSFFYLKNPNNFKKEVKRLGGQLVYGEYGPRLKLPELVCAPAQIDTPWNESIDKRIYIGACVHTKRSDQLFGGDFMLKSEKPLVFCSLGTYNEQYPYAKRLLYAVIDSFRSKQQYNLLLHGGKILDASSMLKRPKNIYIAEFVPQLKVLKKAECFITHGGFSSVREACFYGVPMIVFPNWYDQFGNSAQVVYHNIGMRGDIETVTKNKIDKLVDSVLKSTSIKQSMKKMSSAFKQQENCEKGIQFIENFMKNQCAKNNLKTDNQI